MTSRNYAHFIFIWVWGIVAPGPWTMELSAMSEKNVFRREAAKQAVAADADWGNRAAGEEGKRRRATRYFKVEL